MLANVQAFFLEQNSALVSALFLLPPTHIVYLTDGDRKYTLIFFTPSNGGWKNQVTLSSQGLKVLIILWFHLLFFDLRFLIPPKKLWVNPWTWIYLRALIYLFAHLFNKYRASPKCIHTLMANSSVEVSLFLDLTHGNE